MDKSLTYRPVAFTLHVVHRGFTSALRRKKGQQTMTREQGFTMEDQDQNHAREIGRRIVTSRKELGISQQELADLIHVSQRSMQAYEAGEVIPYRKLSDLSAVLNRPAAWMLHGERASDPVGEMAVLQSIAEKLDRILAALEQRQPAIA